LRLADEFSERGFGRVFVGNALNKHPVVGRAILPTRSCLHVGELSCTQRLPDFAECAPFSAGFHDKVREAGEVVGVGTKELGHLKKLRVGELMVESQRACLHSHSLVLMVLIFRAVMMAAPPP